MSTSSGKFERRSHGAIKTVIREISGLGNLNVIQKLILTHRKESEGVMSKLNESPKKLEPGTCLDLASEGGELSCDGRLVSGYSLFEAKTWPLGLVTSLRRRRVRCK